VNKCYGVHIFKIWTAKVGEKVKTEKSNFKNLPQNP
jgi:hypothetical protein